MKWRVKAPHVEYEHEPELHPVVEVTADAAQPPPRSISPQEDTEEQEEKERGRSGDGGVLESAVNGGEDGVKLGEPMEFIRPTREKGESEISVAYKNENKHREGIKVRRRDLVGVPGKIGGCQ